MSGNPTVRQKTAKMFFRIAIYSCDIAIYSYHIAVYDGASGVDNPRFSAPLQQPAPAGSRQQQAAGSKATPQKITRASEKVNENQQKTLKYNEKSAKITETSMNISNINKQITNH